MNRVFGLLVIVVTVWFASIPSKAYAQFGASVAIDGDTLIVGGPNFSRLEGEAAKVFARTDNNFWFRDGQVYNDPKTMASNFGYSTAIDGNRIYVSSTVEQTISVFERDDRLWRLHSVISPEFPYSESVPSWGAALAFGKHAGDDVVFVGQRRANNYIGAVYVYRWTGQEWNQEATLQPSDAHTNGQFGISLAWNGQSLLVGSSGRNSNGLITGGVYVFTRGHGGVWAEETIITAGRQDPCSLGNSVAVSGDHAIATAANSACGGGSVYFLTYIEDTWSISDSLMMDSDPEAWRIEIGYGGAFVDIDGDIAAYPVRSNSGSEDVAIAIRNPVTNSWSRLSTAFTESGMNIRSIALDDDRLLVGGNGLAEIHAHDRPSRRWYREFKIYSDEHPSSIIGDEIECIAGAADQFECDSISLQSYLPNELILDPDVRGINDLWGWADPQTAREFVLLGQYENTVFVEITDPNNPVVIGNLPKTPGSNGSTWRDIKVYKDHAFIVSDGAGQHGMQVFNLARLRNVPDAPRQFDADYLYDDFASAHNIAINEDTGYAYIVGARSGGETCGGAVHMVNIQSVNRPAFEGCFTDPATGRNGNGYTHDVQCVTYDGPDTAYTGREICLGSNVSALSIADVTDKANPVAVASANYPNVSYAHQGWITDDHQYFLMDDELDESRHSLNTRTLVWDIKDLDDPVLLTEYFGPTEATNHNLFVAGDYAFLANYAAGLHVLDITDISNPVEVAFFDTVPHGNASGFNGAWASYPFFPSGNIAVSSRYQGLFVLRPEDIVDVPGDGDVASDIQLQQNFPNPFNPSTLISYTLKRQMDITLTIVDVLGREVRTLDQGVKPPGRHNVEFDATGLSSGTYFYRVKSGEVTKTMSMTLVK